jgi:CTP synthase (UTP-ammonia lyase)
MTVRIGILADYKENFPPHATIEPALQHAARTLDARVEARWLSSDSLLDDTGRAALEECHGLWAGPGSPYRSLDGMLAGIRFARERGVPFLGTCGGCQHAVLEFARNVLGFVDAASAEYDPYASELFVSALVCSPAGKRMRVILRPGTLAHDLYGAGETTEEYYCNFGLNPAHESTVERGGLRISGRDQDGEARILELPSHPFFIATLFVPQTSSTPERSHPVIRGLLQAALAVSGTRSGLPLSSSSRLRCSD